MTLDDILNIIGIILLMYAGCIGLIGSFYEKDEDIATRTSLSFGNLEHFKSMLNHKYHSKFSFMFIVFGSIALLLPFLTTDDYEVSKCASAVIILSSIILLIIFYFLAKNKVDFKFDKIIAGWHIQALKDNKQKIDLNNHNLQILMDLMKKRAVKTNYNSVDMIMKTAIKKFKIN